ncbi:MAG: L,D-transpeptidase [Aestuariivirga sp.]
MSDRFSRRIFLLGSAAAALTATRAFAQTNDLYGGAMDSGTNDGTGGLWYDPAQLPPAESPEDFPIPQVNLNKIPAQFHRQLVNYSGPEWPGTIVVDPANHFLYHVQEGHQAIRYGVGVGRAGFAWAGLAKVGLKRRWPRWLPPKEMVERDPNARKWINGQPGGPDNPLGARALYLYANGQDTFYRIHGTNAPDSIGKSMSSGCIRMLNQDIAELYLQVPKGTQVVVRPSDGSAISLIDSSSAKIDSSAGQGQDIGTPQ